MHRGMQRGGLHEWLKVDNWPVYDILDKFTDKDDAADCLTTSATGFQMEKKRGTL